MLAILFLTALIVPVFLLKRSYGKNQNLACQHQLPQCSSNKKKKKTYKNASSQQSIFIHMYKKLAEEKQTNHSFFPTNSKENNKV